MIRMRNHTSSSNNRDDEATTELQLRSRTQEEDFDHHRPSAVSVSLVNSLQQEEVDPAPLILSMDEAIDRVGMGKFQARIMVAAGLCFAADAMEILLLSFLSLVLMVEWDLSGKQTSAITASVFAGAFLGTLSLGKLGDHFGRKPIFVLTASVIAIFGMGTAVVQSYNQLILFRFLVGFGVGGITVPYDLLSEFMPSHRRGERLVTTSYFWTCATMLVPVLAYCTLGQSQGHHRSSSEEQQQQSHGDSSNWRLFVACCAIPCVVSAVVGIYAVPESPRYLVANQSNPTKALEILRKASLTNGIDPNTLFPAGTRLRVPQQEEKSTFWDLLSGQWYKTTLLLGGVWGSYALLYYGTVIGVTLVFSGRHNDNAGEDHDSNNNNNNNKKYGQQQGYQFDYLAMIVSSSAEIAGVTWVWFTVDRFGRIPLQMLNFFLGGVLMLALCFLVGGDSPSNIEQQEHHPFLHLVSIIMAFLARMFVYSGSNIVWIVTAELLTTDIRATGHSVANAVARIGAFLATYLVSPNTPLPTIGISMFLITIFNVLCTWNLPETTGRPMGVLRKYKNSGAALSTSDHRIQIPTNEVI